MKRRLFDRDFLRALSVASRLAFLLSSVRETPGTTTHTFYKGIYSPQTFLIHRLMNIFRAANLCLIHEIRHTIIG